MDPEIIKQEIKTLLEHMSFRDDVESIEAHQGMTSRFSVRLRSLAEGTGLRDSLKSFWEEQEGKEEERPDHTYTAGSFVNMLIGEHGANLAALEHILKKIIKKKYGDDQKFTLDINDYRMKRLEDLKQDVKAAAKEVRLYQKEVPLRSMSAFERRIVHLLLAEYPDIATESVGQEPDRRVVIKPYP